MTKTKTKYIDNFINKNRTNMLGRDYWRRDDCALKIVAIFSMQPSVKLTIKGREIDIQ